MPFQRWLCPSATSVLTLAAACAGTDPSAPPASPAPPSSETQPEEGPGAPPPAKAATSTAPSTPTPGALSSEDTESPADPSACADMNDAGNSTILAKKIADISDCDNPKTISGVINGAVDADFYSFRATDGWCKFEPVFESNAPGTELCVFARCIGTEEQAITVCSQGTLSKDDIGTNGCCAAGPGKAVPIMNCSGANDSAEVTVRVRQPTSDACIPYVVTYAL